MANSKTNAQRMLEKLGVKYIAHSYSTEDGKIDGVAVANKVGIPAEQVFKTLVTRAASKEIFVFVIPVAMELDLKAAARAVGAKSVEMVQVKELLSLTGYIRGGCSPVGMKKHYRTVVDSSALKQQTIVVSAGKIGEQIELSPSDLQAAVGCEYAEITHNV